MGIVVKYQAIYKCRLCHEEQTDYFSTEVCQGLVKGMMDEKVLEQVGLPSLDRCHKCENGSIGVMAFQGFRKVE